MDQLSQNELIGLVTLIRDKQDYQEKLDSGADLVQIYTGFIYEGPNIV